MILHELGTPSFAQFNIKHIVFGLTFLDVCNRVPTVPNFAHHMEFENVFVKMSLLI
jgi:hypothetical protein